MENVTVCFVRHLEHIVKLRYFMLQYDTLHLCKIESMDSSYHRIGSPVLWKFRKQPVVLQEVNLTQEIWEVA